MLMLKYVSKLHAHYEERSNVVVMVHVLDLILTMTVFVKLYTM